jgi:predicted subunit of tRNA(5-methylaminomethyl-2-thiouridylate) methyltransferase
MYIDITAGGSFAHKTIAEGREILDKIMENTCFVCESETPHAKLEEQHEEALEAEPKSK